MKRTIGVDWDKRRIALVADKTRNTSKRGGFRMVPMVPRLFDILTAVKAASPIGSTLVCGDSMSRAGVNRSGQRYIKAAGLKPWRLLYIALRKSCEDDFKANGIAEATYTAWLGHGPEVSRQHYVTPTEGEYERITRPQLRLAG